jgi:hypothetical protein
MLGIEVIDGCDVGVVQFGESHGFFVEKLPRMVFEIGSLLENLDGNFALEVFVVGPVNLTHASRAYFFGDSIVASGLPDEGFSTGSLARHGQETFPLYPKQAS